MSLRTADSSFSVTGAGQWNEIIYTKIAVIGDSLSAQWPLFASVWPNILQERLNSAGARVEVRTFSTGNHSFFRAFGTATYGSQTAVQAAIAYKPDVVIVELGGNDAIFTATATGDNRTLAQIQADSDDVFNALKAGLPTALLIQLKMTFLDTANFNSTNVLNKGIIPRFMTKQSAGILSGLDTSEYLGDAVSATNKAILDDYDVLQAHIATISGVQVITVDLFKIERLGVTMIDRIHLTYFGNSLFGGDVLKQLRANAAFSLIVPVIATQLTGNLFEGEDVEALFDDYLVASGDGYVDNTPGVLNGEDVNSNWAINARSIHTDNWFMDYKASFILDGSTVYSSVGPESYIEFLVDDSAPLSALTYSVDGVAFTSAGFTTDFRGRILGKLPLGLINLTNAAHTFRFKVGQAVFGPFTITTAANIVGNIQTTQVGNVGGGEDDLMTYSIPVGFGIPTLGRTVYLLQQGATANNANSKTVRSYFGSTSIFALAMSTNVAAQWQSESWITNTGSSTQRFISKVLIQNSVSTWVGATFAGTKTENDFSTIIVKATGTATSNDDITQIYQKVEFR